MIREINASAWRGISLKKMQVVRRLCLLIAVFWMVCPFPAIADVDWHLVKQLRVDGKPLDVAMSLDEKDLFVLVRGKVLVYSLLDGSIKGAIPVDETADSLRVSPRGDFLILGSSKDQRLDFIQFRIVQEIDISGLPYRGPKDASVTIVVFSDYQ